MVLMLRLKLFLILFADDMVIFANNAAELQTSLDLMYEYCNRTTFCDP